MSKTINDLNETREEAAKLLNIGKTRSDLEHVRAHLNTARKAYWQNSINPLLLSEAAAVMLTQVATEMDRLQCALAQADMQLERDADEVRRTPCKPTR